MWLLYVLSACLYILAQCAGAIAGAGFVYGYVDTSISNCYAGRQEIGRCDTKGPFTLIVRIDYRFDASVDVWKEYIGVNCIIHTKCQHQHQH